MTRDSGRLLCLDRACQRYVSGSGPMLAHLLLITLLHDLKRNTVSKSNVSSLAQKIYLLFIMYGQLHHEQIMVSNCFVTHIQMFPYKLHFLQMLASCLQSQLDLVSNMRIQIGHSQLHLQHLRIPLEMVHKVKTLR